MKDTERHHYIGEHICALRESKGWTQQLLGKKLGRRLKLSVPTKPMPSYLLQTA